SHEISWEGIDVIESIFKTRRRGDVIPQTQIQEPLRAPAQSVAISVRDLKAGYGAGLILKGINMDVYSKQITAIIEPSGCGKSTLIRCMNRMHEVYVGATHEGSIALNGEDIFEMDPVILRQKVGMVFQRPNPFPTMTIFENVAAGLRLNGLANKSRLREI